MRKAVLTLLGVLFFVFFSARFVFAADKMVVKTAAANVVTTPIDYALPYPGLLPDSPFYFLKVARDQVISFLIQSSTDKSFYFLLLSDKRLAGGEVLIDGGKSALGVTTVVSGEEYFIKAVDQASMVIKQDPQKNDLVSKLTVAAAKHDEVILNLMTKVSGEDSLKLTKAYDDNQKSRSRVMEMMQTR